jgi:hypothetical protein
MTTKPKKTKENSLYLPINQVYFDEILNGTKNKEYRAIGPNTVTKYIQNQKVDGETQLLCNFDLISGDNFDMYPNDYMFYNKGVFPYIPKEIKYLDLAVGYRKERDKMTVEVVDISFEPGKDKEGNFAVVSYDEEGRPYKDENGEFTLWNIVFHLGKVVEKDLMKDRGVVE